MKRPGTWIAGTSEVKTSLGSMGAAQGAKLLSVVASPIGGGNVVVNEWSGANAGRQSFAEFKQTSQLSAQLSDGKLLETGKKTIAGMPARWEIET